MKKKVIIVVVIIVLMILLVPIPFKLRDGGTVEWKSLTYSIANVHSIYAVGNESNKYELGYKEGIVIKIFNMTVYNNTKYSLKEEFAIIDNSKEFDCNNIEEEIYRDDEYIYYLPVSYTHLKETFSFFTNSSETIFTKALIAASESFLERPVCSAIAFTNSALFIIFTPFDK